MFVDQRESRIYKALADMEASTPVALHETRMVNGEIIDDLTTNSLRMTGDGMVIDRDGLVVRSVATHLARQLLAGEVEKIQTGWKDTRYSGYFLRYEATYRRVKND